MKTQLLRGIWSVSALILLASGWGPIAPLAADQTEVTEAIRQAQALSRAFRHAAENTTPTVVTLIATASVEQRRETLKRLLEDPRLRQFLPEDAEDELLEGLPDQDFLPGNPTQVGSGVILDDSGIILTNHHVVNQASEVLVRLSDGREFVAEEVKSDPLSDLAIVRIVADTPLETASLGDSSQVQIGDWVIAIGSPFELETTVSAGIISAQGRGIDQIHRGRLLQTDAAINPGNSGGPLVDLEGNVVGINTAIASSHGGYQGIGFAIPINRARWVADELVEHGRVRRSYLGIRIEELTPAAAAELQLPPRSGVYVRDVIAESPAEKAGLRTNDVIVEFAGQRVRGPRDLQDVVEVEPIGSDQPLKILRRGTEHELTVTLESLPGS